MPAVSTLELARQRKSELREWREGKRALYRETLQTTRFYVGRIVIVPRELGLIPSAPVRRSHFRENSRFPEGVSEACGIYRSDVGSTTSKTWAGRRLPLVGSRAQSKDATGGTPRPAHRPR
jgi:hypothetical protein